MAQGVVGLLAYDSIWLCVLVDSNMLLAQLRNSIRVPFLPAPARAPPHPLAMHICCHGKVPIRKLSRAVKPTGQN